MSGSHYASEPPTHLVLRWDDVRPPTLAEWMQRVADSLAALNDAIHIQSLSQMALDRRQAELHTALDEETLYDLRTVDARDADRLAQLELRMDNLVDVAERQARRIARLEAENKALREAVALHADLLQHYRLTVGI